MSTDRELLELAAKAAGLQEWGWMADTLTHVVNNQFVFWQPLTDDGDGARMEAALRLNVEWFDTFVMVTSQDTSARCSEHFISHEAEQAARRMASLRVAAEIGKAMK